MNFKWMLLSFTGRLNRANYWIWSIVISLIYAALSYVGGYSLATSPSDFSLLPLLISLILLWPSLALAVKRTHDRNRSGWFVLLSLVPLLNLWVFIELLFLKGTDGNNHFGVDPLLENI